MFKHLHGRGEDSESAVVGTLHTGNTSTDVEKTAHTDRPNPSI